MMQRGNEAALKRERALAYAFSHQVLLSLPLFTHTSFLCLPLCVCSE